MEKDQNVTEVKLGIYDSDGQPTMCGSADQLEMGGSADQPVVCDSADQPEVCGSADQPEVCGSEWRKHRHDDGQAVSSHSPNHKNGSAKISDSAEMQDSAEAGSDLSTCESDSTGMSSGSAGSTKRKVEISSDDRHVFINT